MNALHLFRSNLSVIIRRHELNSIKTRSLPHNLINFSVISCLRYSDDSRNLPEFGEIESFNLKNPPIKQKHPVDWLPFKWERKPRYNIYEESGDTIRENTIDLSLPKPDFELSDELKDADEKIKQYFSLQTASYGDIKEVCKRHLLKRIQRHPNDFDSLEVKILLRTIQVRSLFQHREKLGKWEIRNSNVILPIMIQKRNKLLKQLREMDNERYLWLLEELKLLYKPDPKGVQRERYTKKWALRTLTKEYCQKMIADKKAAYQEELKKQQADFLEEKKQILAWIEEEKKALNVE